MKSWWIVTHHDRTALEFREVAAPRPRAGEIVVKVRATALNRGELIAGSVVHAGPEKLGGTEASGIVHETGENVGAIRPGERVMGRLRGGFAQFALMDAHQAIPMPERLTWEEAAAIPATFLAAYEMLFPYGKLKRGEWLLVTAASSGVGVASIQIAKLIGARVIGVSGSVAKLEKLKAIGVDVGVATRGADFASRVREATGGNGADVIVNCVGGSAFAECVRALARRGRLAVVGYVDGALKAEFDLSAVHADRLEVFGISSQRQTPEERADAVRGFMRDLMPAFDEGRLRPVIDRVFDFDELPQAKSYMESNAQVGKIVVRVA